MELRELFKLDKYQLTEETKEKSPYLAYLSVEWMRADETNKNNRKYKKSLIEREIKKMKQKIEKTTPLGQMSHPEGKATELQNSSHVVLDCWMSGKKAMAKLGILKNSNGQNLLRLLRTPKIELGISSRGLGSTEGEEVQEDWEWLSLDIVQDPSFETATIDKSNIMESADLNKLEERGKMNEISDENFQKIYEHQLEYQKQRKGYEGSIEEFEKKFGQTIKERLMESLHQRGFKMKDRDKSKEKKGLDSEETLRRRYEQARESGYRGDFESYKKIQKVDEETKYEFERARNLGFKGTLNEFLEEKEKQEK